jgi:hypothetical protein
MKTLTPMAFLLALLDGRPELAAVRDGRRPLYGAGLIISRTDISAQPQIAFEVGGGQEASSATSTRLSEQRSTILGWFEAIADGAPLLGIELIARAETLAAHAALRRDEDDLEAKDPGLAALAAAVEAPFVLTDLFGKTAVMTQTLVVRAGLRRCSSDGHDFEAFHRATLLNAAGNRETDRIKLSDEVSAASHSVFDAWSLGHQTWLSGVNEFKFVHHIEQPTRSAHRRVAAAAALAPYRSYPVAP